MSDDADSLALFDMFSRDFPFHDTAAPSRPGMKEDIHMIKLKVSKLIDAQVCLTNIINSQREFPQKGEYRIARMHDKLMAAFQTANKKRDAMITKHGDPLDAQGEPYPEGKGDPKVSHRLPGDDLVRMAAFDAEWAEIADLEEEFDARPIPLSQLTVGENVAGKLKAYEIILLGPLVYDDSDPDEGAAPPA